MREATKVSFDALKSAETHSQVDLFKRNREHPRLHFRKSASSVKPAASSVLFDLSPFIISLSSTHFLLHIVGHATKNTMMLNIEILTKYKLNYILIYLLISMLSRRTDYFYDPPICYFQMESKKLI